MKLMKLLTIFMIALIGLSACEKSISTEEQARQNWEEQQRIEREKQRRLDKEALQRKFD